LNRVQYLWFEMGQLSYDRDHDGPLEKWTWKMLML